MRWLQWSTIDLEQGLGGVEVHARALARELKALGHEAAFSLDPSVVIGGHWDVVHTHGSALPLRLAAQMKNSGFVHVHTLHGTTLGRMAACGEWLWPGGYAAAARETAGVLNADVVLSVAPDLHLFALAERIGKASRICWNGWDAAAEFEKLPQALSDQLARLGKFWVFVGRGDDRVKAVDRLLSVCRLMPDLKIVAAPGTGFESESSVVTTGRLSSGQVTALLEKAEGLLLTSNYEGNSLVVLEALAQGVPVVTTAVGAASHLFRVVQGLFVSDTSDPRALTDAMRAAQKMPNHQRVDRAKVNQQALSRWRQVAVCAVDAVEKFKKRQKQ